MMLDVGSQYRQHLTEADQVLVAQTAGGSPDMERALSSDDLAQVVFGDRASRSLMESTTGPSPFLAFAVAVHQTAKALEHATYVEERWAPRQRIPIFDVLPLREFLSSPHRRFFLIELLSSYTHISSGVTWTKTRKGWRRRRFSELDPVHLAELLETTDRSEHAGVYRRLGDLSLFLSGLFPDHHASERIGTVGAVQLIRHSGLPLNIVEESGAPPLLERLGPRWYELAVFSVQRAGFPSSALGVAAEMATRFGEARRVLNLVSDRYLFPLRDQWFGTI